MNYNVVIDPIYLIDEFSLGMHGKLPWFDKYEIFRLLSIYDKIYVDKRWFLEIVEIFSKDKVLIKIFNQLFKEDILVDAPFEKILLDYVVKAPLPDECIKFYEPRFHNFIKIGMLRRIHEIDRVVEDVDILPLQSIYTHLQFSFDEGSFLLTSMPDLLICFASPWGEAKTNTLKDDLKKWSIGKTFSKYCIPSLEIKTYGEYEKFIEVRKSGIKTLQKRINELASEFGGYILRENEANKIRDRITASENEFFGIKKLFDKISITTDVATDIASLIIAAPVGAIKTITLGLLENNDIKNKNLEWLVYTHSLKAFQRKELKTGKCKMCNLSIAEIDSLTEDEVNKYIFGTSNLCLGHMIVYLNIRKFLNAYGKDLLKLIKEKENDKDWNLNTPLGMD